MQSATLSFQPDTGWSVDPLPDLDSESTLVLVFGGTPYLDDASALERLSVAFPKSVVLGCSSAGEIHGGQIRDGSLSVAVMKFERTRLQLTSAEVSKELPSDMAGEQIARALAAPDLRAVFILSDGLVVNGTDLLRGIHRVVGTNVTVTGGMAGDGSRFARTWVFTGGAPRSGVVAAVGLYGDDVRVSHGSRGGWDVFGPERVVTRSVGNVLYELDGEPALALYKSYLGDRAAGLPATALLFPLALRRSDAAQTVVRTILSVDEEHNTMTFAGDVPEDAVAQLMRANFDRLIDGASEAKVIRHVVLPGLKPVALFCIVLSTVSGLEMFDEPMVLTQGGPGDSTLTVVMFVYQQGFQFLQLGYAAAASYVLTVLIVLVTLVQRFWLRERGR